MFFIITINEKKCQKGHVVVFFLSLSFKAMLRLHYQNCTVLSHGCYVFFVRRGDGAVVFLCTRLVVSHTVKLR